MGEYHEFKKSLAKIRQIWGEGALLNALLNQSVVFTPFLDQYKKDGFASSLQAMAANFAVACREGL